MVFVTVYFSICLNFLWVYCITDVLTELEKVLSQRKSMLDFAIV